jgi:hypothetical protein
MKISSEIRLEKLYDKPYETVPIFYLYLDTQNTGYIAKDTFTTAIDVAAFGDYQNSDKICSIVLPLLQELIYHAYGASPLLTTPLTDWKDTKFDRDFPNGVKI